MQHTTGPATRCHLLDCKIVAALDTHVIAERRLLLGLLRCQMPVVSASTTCDAPREANESSMMLAAASSGVPSMYSHSSGGMPAAPPASTLVINAGFVFCAPTAAHETCSPWPKAQHPSRTETARVARFTQIVSPVSGSVLLTYICNTSSAMACRARLTANRFLNQAWRRPVFAVTPSEMHCTATTASLAVRRTCSTRDAASLRLLLSFTARTRCRATWTQRGWPSPTSHGDVCTTEATYHVAYAGAELAHGLITSVGTLDEADLPLLGFCFLDLLTLDGNLGAAEATPRVTLWPLSTQTAVCATHRLLD